MLCWRSRRDLLVFSCWSLRGVLVVVVRVVVIQVIGRRGRRETLAQSAYIQRRPNPLQASVK